MGPRHRGRGRARGERRIDVALLADAGPSTGLGHVTRSAALADALRRHGARALLAAPDDDAVREAALSLAVDHQPWDGRTWDARSDLIVVDSYRLMPEDLVRLRPKGGAIAEVSDGARLRTEADFVIDGAPGSAARRYGGPRLREAFVGERYALVPRCFVRQRGLEREDRVVVSIGSGAPAALLDAVVAAAGGSCAVDVVAGPYTRFDARPPATVHRGLGPDGVADLFGRARVGVVGGGQTLLQAAATGLACVAIVVADNQRPQSDAMLERGAVIDVVPMDDLVRVDAAVRAAVASRDAMDAVATRAAATIDGGGADRVAAALLSALGAAA